jgi:hypothetical protein
MEIIITHWDEAHEEIVVTTARHLDWYAESIIAHQGCTDSNDDPCIVIEDIISIEGDETLDRDGTTQYAVPTGSGSIHWHDWDTVHHYMDADICGQIHDAGTALDEAHFLAEYKTAHALKFGAIFTID